MRPFIKFVATGAFYRHCEVSAKITTPLTDAPILRCSLLDFFSNAHENGTIIFKGGSILQRSLYGLTYGPAHQTNKNPTGINRLGFYADFFLGGMLTERFMLGAATY